MIGKMVLFSSLLCGAALSMDYGMREYHSVSSKDSMFCDYRDNLHATAFLADISRTDIRMYSKWMDAAEQHDDRMIKWLFDMDVIKTNASKLSALSVMIDTCVFPEHLDYIAGVLLNERVTKNHHTDMLDDILDRLSSKSDEFVKIEHAVINSDIAYIRETLSSLNGGQYIPHVLLSALKNGDGAYARHLLCPTMVIFTLYIKNQITDFSEIPTYIKEVLSAMKGMPDDEFQIVYDVIFDNKFQDSMRRFADVIGYVSTVNQLMNHLKNCASNVKEYRACAMGIDTE